MFGHRKGSGRFWTDTGVPGGYRDPPGSILGLMGLSGRRGGAARAAARPSPSSPNWTRRGAAAPFFLLLLSPFLPFSYSNKERRSPTPGGSSTSPLARPPWPAASPPLLLYIRGQGAPLDTQVDLLISPSRMRCPLHHNPPQSYRSGA